jgi:hypothetical protein
MKYFAAVQILATLGCCPRPQPHTGAGRAALSRPSCLRYPTEARPAFEASARELASPAKAGERPFSILVAGDGDFVALTDSSDRLLGWSSDSDWKPVLYSGDGTLKALGRHRSAFLVRAGQAYRVDLATGHLALTGSGARQHDVVVDAPFPRDVESVFFDAAGRYAVITSRHERKPGISEIIIEDDCALHRKRPADCPKDPRFKMDGTHVPWELVIRMPRRSWNAQIAGHLLVSVESPEGDYAPEIVARDWSSVRAPSASWLNAAEIPPVSWAVTLQEEAMLVVDNFVVEWGSTSPRLRIHNLADGSLVREVNVLSNCSGSNECSLSVESGRDSLLVVNAENPGSSWEVVDIARGTVVWRSTRQIAGVGLGPNGKLFVVDETGVCSERVSR